MFLLSIKRQKNVKTVPLIRSIRPIPVGIVFVPPQQHLLHLAVHSEQPESYITHEKEMVWRNNTQVRPGVSAFTRGFSPN